MPAIHCLGGGGYRIRSSKLPLSTLQVLGQPGLQKNVSQKQSTLLKFPYEILFNN